MKPPTISSAHLYDTLAARMHAAGGSTRTLGFTATTGGEGTSSVAIGTALAMASLQSEPVLLIDGNWLSPALTEGADTPEGPDLASCLHAPGQLSQSLVRCSQPTLFFLPSGRLTGAPASLGGLPALVAEAAANFRFVMVDLPPILAATALVMTWSALLDQLFVVVRRGTTRRHELRRAIAAITPITEPELILIAVESIGRRRRYAGGQGA